MDTQVRTAKAVVDIDEVHFLKHTEGEPVITQELLDGGGWFSVATLKGTVEVNQDPLSLTKINIDQSNMPIGISTEPGDFNINFEMPSMKAASLANWLDHDFEHESPLEYNGKHGYGYDFNADVIDMVMLVTTKTKETFVFPNIQGSVAMGQDEKAWVLKYAGMVLGASNPENRDVYVLAEDGNAPSGDSGDGGSDGESDQQQNAG